MARMLSVLTMETISQYAYELSEPDEMSSPGSGEWIIIPIRPDGRREAAVTLSGTASWSGSVQGTNSPLSDVEADTAISVDWPDGVVSVTTNRILYNFTAIRQVNATGSTRLEVNS